MANDTDNPFLKSTSACLRAMAGGTQHAVRFSGNQTVISPTEIRLPAPNKDETRMHSEGHVSKTNLYQADANIRGAADSAALWLAHHSEDIHQNKAPMAQQARTIFDAVERARVEAIGANNMPGVASNLRTSTEAKFAQTTLPPPGPADTDDQSQTIAHVTNLLIREALTGEKPPKSVAMSVDLWRPWIENRAGDLIDQLGHNIDDQASYAELSRKLIGALETDLGDPIDPDDDNNDDDSEAEGDQGEDDNANPQGESDDSDSGDSMDQPGEASSMEASEGDGDGSDED
ncbi:MAG: cobaltochelatase subunit CobT, partial [Candidatus Puniceispirillales bacterium]